MGMSPYLEEQINSTLRKHDACVILEEVYRKVGIGHAKSYNWKMKYGGLMPSEMKRLKQLEE